MKIKLYYRKLCINGVCYVKLEITNINYHHYSFLLIAPNTPKQKASDTIIWNEDFN
jgi:hypothetical protein